jgi:predicted RNA-binding Zn-ribbon protein involved in translation (DUF1610 family)
MPNSFRKRIKKLAYLGYISGEEAREIIQALNKQRPMPRIEPEDKFYLWACPNCREDFISDGEEKHCRECGQALTQRK